LNCDQETHDRRIRQRNDPSHLPVQGESHHAKLRIGKLAELSLVTEDVLKPKEYADRVSELLGIAASFEESRLADVRL
jgi:hypothetical protein